MPAATHNAPAKIKTFSVAAMIALATGCIAPQAIPTSSDLDQRIEACIDRLVEVDSFDSGISPSTVSSDFPPVEDLLSIGIARFGGPAHGRHPAMTQLVSWGPAAIDALLRHLDDRRLTQLSFAHGPGMGGTSYGIEVGFRDGNAREIRALREAGVPTNEAEEEAWEETQDPFTFERHHFTVGDVCFVALGMITNRQYAAFRYQPTACEVINSPTQEPRIAQAVRGVWNGATAEDLFRELAADFASENPFAQEGAVARLLYYFPSRATPLITQRFTTLLQAEDEGYEIEQLMHSCAWSPIPEIRAWLRALAADAANTRIAGFAKRIGIGACTFADVPPSPAHFDVLRRMAEAVINSGMRGGDQGRCAVLRVFLDAYPHQHAKILALFLDNSNHATRLSVIEVCGQIQGIDPTLLLPLLDDRAEGHGQFLFTGPGTVADPKEEDVRIYRVCDNTYEVICWALGDQATRAAGAKYEMDARISALRARMRRPPAERTFTAEEISQRATDRRRRAPR